MQIKLKDIVLRDPKECDMADDARWVLTDNEWHDWDAPWEKQEDIESYNLDEEREKALKKIRHNGENPDKIRYSFELDFMDAHIGGVNCYMTNEDYDYTKENDGVYYTVGIDICEKEYQGRGIGTVTLCAFIKYLIDNGCDKICTQTWSGNFRMIKLAEKLGFYEVKRIKDKRFVNGKNYDGLTFKLDNIKFERFYQLLIQTD